MKNPIIPAEMRALEQAAIASGTVTGLTLMERAGWAAADIMRTACPDMASGAHKAVVLCGPGNNGGDGFVIARALAAYGWAVDVFALGPCERLPPDARTNYDRWAAGHPVRPISDAAGVLDTPTPTPQLIVDALFGIGLSRPPEGLDDLMIATTQAVQRFKQTGKGPRVVAIDLPSSLNADTGQLMFTPKRHAFTANLTITFHAPKTGHLTGQGPEACGRLVTADIGL